MTSRRQFLAQASAALAAGSVATAQDDTTAPRSEAWPVIFFEKPVQNLPYEEIAEELAKMGAQGIEATIRKGGHILPENASKEVPAMCATLKAAGLHTIIAASSFLKADQKTADYLKVLRDNGITQYRTNYYRYSKRGNPMKEALRFHEEAKALAELNAELGMQAIYQIHSGARFGGSLLWDAALIFRGIDPAHFGVGYDLRHSKTDTGNSWELATQVIQEHVNSLYVKDAQWQGERTDQLTNVPLGTGFVTEKMFSHVRSQQKPMPISLHVEWGAHTLYPMETAREAWPLIRRDMATLKKWTA